MRFDILPLLLAAVGGYFLIRLRFFFIIHPVRTLKRGIRAIYDKRALRSFSLALAGTLGIGNVFGVALGIIIGGAGSLFWLFISMIFAMVIKYAEVVLTSDNLNFDSEIHGGFYYVIRTSFFKIGGALSTLYAAVLLMLSLVMGASLQTSTINETALEILEISPCVFGIMLVIIVFLSICRGINKIEKITSIAIPLTTIIYIIITFRTIFLHFDQIDVVVNHIVLSAFNFDSALGGAFAFLASRPVREGFARGLLSNEAGAGTSAIAHARSGVLSPASAGLLGVFEVWFDTGFICMLTGFSILLSVPDPSIFESGMQLVMFAVGNSLGGLGKYLLLVSVFVFAIATVICWYYYGTEAWTALFGKRRKGVFLLLFLLFVFIGCCIDTIILIELTDALMLIATLLTLAALIKNSDRVIALSECGGIILSEKRRLRRLCIKENVFSKEEKDR